MMNASSNKSIQEIWFIDKNNKLKFMPIATGITDGKNTEIIRSRDLTEGTKVITSIQNSDSESSSSTSTTNALTGQGTKQRMGGGPPPPGGF